MKAIERRLQVLEARDRSGRDWGPILDTLTDDETNRLTGITGIIEEGDPDGPLSEVLDKLTVDDRALLERIGVVLQ